MGALIRGPELHPHGGNPISQDFVEGSMSELSLEPTQDLARPTGELRRRGGKEDRGHKAIKMNGGDETPDVRNYVSWVWLVQFSSVAQSCLFVTPWTAACQTSLSITSSQNLLKPMSIMLVMPSNHLTLCRIAGL